MGFVKYFICTWKWFALFREANHGKCAKMSMTETALAQHCLPSAHSLLVLSRQRELHLYLNLAPAFRSAFSPKRTDSILKAYISQASAVSRISIRVVLTKLSSAPNPRFCPWDSDISNKEKDHETVGIVTAAVFPEDFILPAESPRTADGLGRSCLQPQSSAAQHTSTLGEGPALNKLHLQDYKNTNILK